MKNQAHAVLRAVLALVLVCGLLDATAAFNTASFGVGVYIVASAYGAFLLIARAWTAPYAVDSLRSDLLKPAVLSIVLLWTFALLQIWHQRGEPLTLFTQTVLRTILLGHLIICLTLIRSVNDPAFVNRVVIWFLGIYITYGLYDFGAQILGWPRFLDVLRNSQSVAIADAVGAQGWIKLPRLSSLSAEPSHTVMPVALAFFMFTQLKGWPRRVLLTFVIMFCVGTFARTLWIAMLGAAMMSATLWVLSRFRAPLASKLTGIGIVAAAILLPVIVGIAPFVALSGDVADLSTVERFDSARTAILLFFDHPLLGLGFYGWDGKAMQFSYLMSGPASSFKVVHNGFAVYLVSLGIIGIVLVYMPSLLIVRARGLSPAQKGWWIGAYSLALLGGDYLALPSTWTMIAVVVTYNWQAMTKTTQPHEGIAGAHPALV